MVFFGGYYSAAGKLVKQLRDGGVQGTFMSGDGSARRRVHQGRRRRRQRRAAELHLLVPRSAPTDPAVQKFATDYKAKFNVDPATYSAEGFDATNAFLQAIDAGKTDPADINDFVTKIDFKGVSKQIKFDPNGELASDLLFITEVKDGKLAFLGDTTPGEAVRLTVPNALTRAGAGTAVPAPARSRPQTSRGAASCGMTSPSSSGRPPSTG